VTRRRNATRHLALRQAPRCAQFAVWALVGGAPPEPYLECDECGLGFPSLKAFAERSCPVQDRPRSGSFVAATYADLRAAGWDVSLFDCV
jgi:hypothetical protein